MHSWSRFSRRWSSSAILLLPIVACDTATEPAAPGIRSDAVVSTSVAIPTVSGPIAAAAAPGDPSHAYPFFATAADLTSYGYVEEEFFLEGTAARFTTPAMATADTVDAGHPYRTRMLVRRPASAARFNGTVLVEWLNVTAFHDLDALWISNHEHLMRRGFAYVGVSVQRAGIHIPPAGLRLWSPARYGTLDVTKNGTFLNDTLAYDIYSQAGAAIAGGAAVDPMGGLDVKRMIAVGVSQGAMRLAVYHNAVHPLAGVYDGFMLIGGGAQVRALTSPVFKVLSESDLVNQQQVAWRQAPSPTYRRWEVAGASHIDHHVMETMRPLQLRDLGAAPDLTVCDSQPPLSRIPMYYVINASLEHLVDWVRRGVQPPLAPDIQMASLAPLLVARDADGNALGGLRLSQHAVPTATNSGVNGPFANGWCRTVGRTTPFSQTRLNALYPTRQSYLNRVVDWTNATKRAGWILGHDAGETIAAAAGSGIGKK